MKLYEIAHSRTGDKGNISNLSLIPYDEKDFEMLKEKVTADGFGLNVAPGDAAALADAIEALYNSPDTRREMGQKAKLIAETQFDRPVSYEAIVSIVTKLTGGEA